MSEEAESYNYEPEARETGWTPQESFKGDPERWVDAQTWVERGRTVMPFLKKDRERLMMEVGTLRGAVATTQQQLHVALQNLETFKKFHEEESQRRVEEALRNLRHDKAEAMREDDFDKVVEIEAAIDKIQKKQAEPAPTPTVAATTQQDFTQTPVFKAWAAQHQDILNDPMKASYAASIGTHLYQAEGLREQALLDRVVEEVEARFGSAPPPSRVTTGRRSGGATPTGEVPKGYNDLSPEAKKICSDYELTLVGPNKAFKTKEEFRKYYVSTIYGDKK